MTDKEIIDDVADALTNTGILASISRWVNDFISDLSRDYIFSHLQVTASPLALTSGNNTYPLANVAYIKNVWIPERRLYSVEEVFGDERGLTESMPLWNTETGDVMYYLWNGVEFIFVKVPAVNDTVYVSYQKYATPIDPGKTTEYLGFPRDWHKLISLNAQINGFKSEGNMEMYQATLSEYRFEYKKRKPRVYRNPDRSQVMQSENFSRRPPLARLPWER